MATRTEDSTTRGALRHKLPLALSIAALVVALLGTTGPAVAHGVRHALFAHNAGKVDGKNAVSAGASVNRRKGKLVATSRSTGRLPNNIIAKAPDANLLDGLNSTAFLRSGAGAVTTDKLADGAVTSAKLAPDVGLGFFTGRLDNLAESGSAGPASGLSQAATTPNGVETLSPDREIRMSELAARLTAPVLPGEVVQVVVNAFQPNGTFITQLTCFVPESANECSSAGPSGVVPPRSFLVLEVGPDTAAGTDLLFSWRAQAP